MHRCDRLQSVRGGGWSKMKVSLSVSSQSILDFYEILVRSKVRPFDSKCPFMTLLYIMYKPINFIPVYSQNCVTCQMI